MRPERSNIHRLRPVAIIGVLPIVLAACTSAATVAPPAPTQQPTSGSTAAPISPTPAPFTVRFVANVGGLGDWAPYVGLEKGFFKEDNIDFKFTTLASQGDIFSALVSGQADVGISSLPTALTAALQSAPTKIIATTQAARPDSGYDSRWAVLPASAIKSPADLKGKKVHIFAESSLAQAITRSVLGKAGIVKGEYQEVSTPFPQSFSIL